MARQIAAARIRSAGFGPRNPLFGNDTESGGLGAAPASSAAGPDCGRG